MLHAREGGVPRRRDGDAPLSAGLQGRQRRGRLLHRRLLQGGLRRGLQHAAGGRALQAGGGAGQLPRAVRVRAVPPGRARHQQGHERGGEVVPGGGGPELGRGAVPPGAVLHGRHQHHTGCSAGLRAVREGGGAAPGAGGVRAGALLQARPRHGAEHRSEQGAAGRGGGARLHARRGAAGAVHRSPVCRWPVAPRHGARPEGRPRTCRPTHAAKRKERDQPTGDHAVAQLHHS
mmetsp:Transcript_36156/g.92405  ORF Transcript_36156/g.92405 Transcript_36156/m.92405 type:complete len:233 (+) Transcript_36156:1425-2123(+)